MQYAIRYLKSDARREHEMMAANSRISGRETFHWGYQIFDISALLQDLDRGGIKEYMVSTFNRYDIERYRAFLEGVPHQDVPVGLVQQHRIQVDLAYASTLNEEDLARPIIMLHVGHDEGMIELLDLEKGANYVMADGNHRVIRAYQLQCQEMPLVAIPRYVAERYLIPQDGIKF